MSNTYSDNTGFIRNDNQSIVYYRDGFSFTFIDGNTDVQDTLIIKPTEDGFIWGESHSGHDIAIYAGNKDVYIRGHGGINTGAYIQYSTNALVCDMSKVYGIEFRGGTLNQLFDRHARTWEHTENGDIVIHNKDNGKEYSFLRNEDEYKIHIYSTESISAGCDGVQIRDTGTRLWIEFPKYEPLKNVFKHVANIKEMMSFMMFRQNVGFDEIKIIHEEDEHGIPASSQLFLRENAEFTQKSLYDAISFDDLGDGISGLLKILYDDSDKKPSYMVGFMPRDDHDVYMMTNTKVKEICSSLECELCFVNDDSNEDKQLNELIKKIKSMVKEHRKSDMPLSAKTYDLIFSSMSHWTMSASDRIVNQYHEYKREMMKLGRLDLSVTDDDIREVVKYRNHVTHGSHRIMDMRIAGTAHRLAGLVYCMILTRIGVDRDKIAQMCFDGKITG